MRLSTTSACLLAIAAVGGLALTGCGNRDQAPPAATTLPTGASNDVPDWVNDPNDGGKVLGAYGVAERMLGGEQAQVTNARTAARQELASSINSKIQSVVKNWIREGGEITTQNNSQMAMTMFESSTRNIVNQNLSGSVQKKRWIDEKTGKLYVWIVVNPDIAKAIAEQTKAAARESKEIRSHLAAKIEADKAFNDLDKLIDKELGVTK